jgi:lipopolysaccharide transport system permease protein
MGGVVGLYRHGALIKSLVKRDLAARYKGSALGLLWSVAHPLVMLALYTYIFSEILRVRVGDAEGTGNFAIFLFCGLLPWNAVAEGVNRSAGVIVEHANLIKRTLFPAEVLPIYPVISGIVNQIIGLGILFGALLLVANPLHPVVLMLPVVLALQVALTVGLAWAVAAITVFVRDLGQIVGMLLTVWLFLTPIFYPPSLIPERFHVLLAINPLHALIDAYRGLILRGQMPSPDSLALLAAFSLAFFLIGYLVFTRMQGAFADVI